MIQTLWSQEPTSEKKAFYWIPDWSYNRLWIPGNKFSAFQQHAVWLRYLQCLNQVTVFSLDAANTRDVATDQRWIVSLQEVWSNLYLLKTWREMLKLVNLACTYDRWRLYIQAPIQTQGISIKTECTQLYCPHLSVSLPLKAWESKLHRLVGENCLSEVAGGVEAGYFTDLNWHQTPAL